MAKIISNVATTETFSAWLDKTNQLASSFANVVSVDSTNPATFPQGTAGVNGVLIANTLTVTTGLLTANASANIVGSANVTVAVNVGANVTANTSALKVGNSTVNSIITSTTASVGSNVVANTSALLIGNSSVNTVITSSSIDTDGSLSVLGATSISNTLGAGNTTITGFANVSSTLAAGDTTINGFINVSSTANVGGAVNLRSTLAVNGAVTVPNTAALGNTTVTGFINVSTTANVGGATNLRGDATVNGALTVVNTAAVGNTTVTGFINVSTTANVGGATNLRSTLVVNGAVTIANSVASGNNDLTGYINVSTTANVGGATTLRSTLVVNGAVTIANTLSSGNTSTADLSVTGFANVSGTANVGGAVNLRDTLAVNGAVTIANTLSSGNTSTANLSVTGFANVSGTANVGGATNLRSTLTVNGAVTIANTLSSGNTSTANLSVTGFANISSTLAAGNTTITGFANVSGTANVGGATNLRSTLDVVGATAITNTLSSGNTSTANLSVTGFANVSGTANVGGATNLRSTLVVNGAVTIANTLSSGNTSTADLSVTGFANVSGTANVGGATTLRSTLAVNGAVTIANTLSSGNTSTANLSVTGFANISSTLAAGDTTITGFANVSGTANVGGAANLRGDVAVNGAVTISNTLSSGNTTVTNLTVSGTINRNPTITLGGDLTGSVTLTDLQNGTLTATIAADSIALGTDTTGNYVATIAVANGISGAVSSEGSTPTIRVVPNTGIVANADGVFVNSAYIATISANNASYLGGELAAYYTNATNISTGTLAVARGGTGVGTSTGTGSVVLSASPTFTGDAGFANITITGIINANNSIGSAGQVLRTDGTGKVYWANPLLADDTGFIEDVTNGVGLSKGGTASIPSLAVIANSGIIASTDGVFVKSHTGIIVNTDGVSVNAAYIATISANNATYLGGQLPAYYTNATNISTGTLAVARGGTGATTFTSGGLLRGNGTSAVSVASAADIVAAIGTTRVANATYADSSGSAGSATTATRATNSDNALVTNDNASFGTFYPVWVDATAGDRAIKISSTKLNFNPSTGILTATGFSGNGASLTSISAENISTGTLPVGRGGTGVTTSTGTTSVVLSASPTLTGIPLAPTAAADTNSNQIATTAYVIGQGYLKSGTAASTYLPLAGGTVTGNLTVSGNLTIDGTTTNINTTNLVVEDKNIILGDVTTPTNTTADGGGITLNGATNKTLNWVNSTGAWTSSEDFNLLTGKAYYINGSLVLSSTSLAVGANVSANVTAFFVGNSTVNTFITQNLLDIGGQLNANGGVGTAGQVLVSGGAGNVYWTNQVVDTNTTYDLLSVANTTQGVVRLDPSSADANDDVLFIGQDEIAITSNSTAVYVDHADVSRTNNTSAASPASGGNFTAIDSITTNARGHVTAINTKTVTLPVDPDTNTTYDLATIANTTVGVVTLDPSTGANDDVRFIGAGSVTVTSDGVGNVTITGTDTNTTYDLLGVANTQANQGILRLDPLSGTDDDVFFVGQDDIVVSSITGTIQIDHADITRTNNTSTASPASGGTFTAIDSISTNARGHVTAINTKTVTLPVDPDTNTTYDLATVANTVANEGLINLIGSNSTTDTGKIIGQDEIVVSSNPTAVYIDHADVARSNNTSTASPASGGTFTVIDSITTNARGHVTAINTKTVTLPVDPDTNTTYDLLTVANTTQGVVRLASSGNANDNINFVGAGGVTVTSDASGAVTITGQVGDITAVTAGDGLTGGGTSGDVTLNVGAGDGITVNPDNIAVNTTVVRTTGDQTIGGTKTFSSTILLANGGFMFSSDGSQDTGINWASDGVMNVRSNGVTIGQFNSTGFTGTAGAVAWTNVSGRPTAVSSFTNDSGYITSAGRAFPRRSDGGDLNFYWSGQVGQPTWLWGGNDGNNMYVYNPSNFSVNYATSAGSAGSVTNGVYTTGDQTIGGTKTFSSTISGSINGNAGTATKASTVNNTKNSGAISMWTGTLAEYNAIGTKDSTTLYFVT
jgi:hypothetical protein